MNTQGLSKRINELYRLNEMQKTLDAEKKKVRTLIIEGMKELNLEEHKTNENNLARLVRYTETRLNTSKIKEYEPGIYEKYSYTNEITKLTIN